ncbi:hypothetical protein [Brucella intermedia]|uniref:hypothetical protein n=1 Tax=Brucella intermedia TaxID=94625 RepID=UPI00236201B1|nr:hypothetical protein [Brucella intermedia]
MLYPINNGELNAQRPVFSSSTPELSNAPHNTQFARNLQRSRSMPSSKAITNGPTEEPISSSRTQSVYSEAAALTLSRETGLEVPATLQRSHSMSLGQAVATLHRSASSPGRVGHLGERRAHTVIDMDNHTVIDIPEHAAIRSLFLSQIQMPSDLTEDIRLGLINHFSEVCIRLAEKGETVEDVQALAKKALRRDYVAAFCGGAVKEVPAAVMGFSYDLVNKVFSGAKEGDNDLGNAAIEGSKAKAAELAVDAGCEPSITFQLVPSEAGDRYYLAPKLDILAEPVKQLKEAMGEPGSSAELKKELKRGYALWQTKGTVVGVTSFAAEALFSPEVSGQLENFVGNGSRLVVGAAKDGLQYAAATKKGQFSMLYLFGRKDWETVYDNLKKSPSSDPVWNAAKNSVSTVGNYVVSNAPKAFKDAVVNTFSPHALGRAALAIPGAALTALTRAYVKDKAETYLGAKRLVGDFAGKMISSVPEALTETAGEPVGEQVERGMKGLYERASEKLRGVFPRELSADHTVDGKMTTGPKITAIDISGNSYFGIAPSLVSSESKK